MRVRLCVRAYVPVCSSLCTYPCLCRSDLFIHPLLRSTHRCLPTHCTSRSRQLSLPCLFMSCTMCAQVLAEAGAAFLREVPRSVTLHDWVPTEPVPHQWGARCPVLYAFLRQLATEVEAGPGEPASLCRHHCACRGCVVGCGCALHTLLEKGGRCDRWYTHTNNSHWMAWRSWSCADFTFASAHT